MSASYRANVSRAFEALSEGLAPFVDNRMRTVFSDEDWIMMAATKLGKRRDVLVSLTDPHFQLEVINRWWGPAFSQVLDDDMRQVVTDLRTARNYWAHPDEDHPFDFDYALQVHGLVEELLIAVDAPEVDRIGDLTTRLRLEDAHEQARESGRSDVDVLLEQLGDLQAHLNDLQAQLAEARQAAQSATGQSKAFARQLAELQIQYAAVAGLRDDYLVIQDRLVSERERREGLLLDTSQIKGQLASTEEALAGLQDESLLLREKLAAAQMAMSEVDPIETEIGRRWMWLVAVLLVMLGLLLATAFYVPPA